MKELEFRPFDELVPYTLVNLFDENFLKGRGLALTGRG